MLDINKFFFSSIKTYLNISDHTINHLKRLEIITMRDLLFYRPTTYQTRIISPNLSLLKTGLLIQSEVIIQEILIPSKKTHPLKILASNYTGSVLLIFFNKPPYFIFNKLQIGSKCTIKGKVQIFSNLPQIVHPEFIFNNNSTDSIEPIYPLTYGIVNSQLYSYIKQAIVFFEKAYHDIADKSLDIKNYIKALLEDIKILHFYNIAANCKNLEQIYKDCIRRLAEKELFSNQLTLQQIRTQIHAKQGNIFIKAPDLQASILKNLPFELTSEQKKAIEEIEQDQSSPIEMMRLLQGDVGSGKTIVALLTMVNVVASKFQAALMAPTDLLANQHYQIFIKTLAGTDVKVALLTGKLPIKEKKKILLAMQQGEIDILIGTHTLFQEKMNFKNLGYIVIDEQQRFGVQQRFDLINKASNPDVLVMTATPIPRSLTLIMFGYMAISKLLHKPKNRLPIITSIMPKSRLNDLILVLDRKLKSNEKIYWICPVIDQKNTENTEELANARDNNLMDVKSRLITIENIYPNITAAIHGKMKNEDKDIIMQQFIDGGVDILVATTVIEVGINVPQATLVVIENAEQFGLAQLHQIRGRVGRGELQSHCILLYDPKRLSQVAKSRFEVMRNSNDGFYIAEQDLLLRGSGEILGTKQSGEIRFFFAELNRDTDLLIKTNKLTENTASNETTALQIKLFSRSEVNPNYV